MGVLKAVVLFGRKQSIGKVVPDLPAQSRAFLVRGDDVGVWQIGPPWPRLTGRHDQMNCTGLDYWEKNRLSSN